MTPNTYTPAPVSDRRRIGVAILLLIFTLGGLWLLWVLAESFRATIDTADWRPVTAQIVSASIEEGVESESGETAYALTVRYRYQVDGNIYESDRIRLSGEERYGTQEAAAEALQGYLENGGQGVVAYYNPVNPAEAALNLRPPVYLPLFVGFYWIILLVFLIPALRSWWASRRTPEP